MKGNLIKLLRWSEKYTGTDMVYLAKGGFWLMLGTAVTSLLSLVTMYMFANYMPKNMYGIYQYFLSALSIITITSLAGMNVATTRSIARGHDRTLIDLLKTKFKWSLLGSFGALTVGIYYILQENTLLGYGFCILAAIAPLWNNLGIYVSYLQGKKRFDKIALYDIAIHTVLAAVLVFTLLNTSNPLIALVAYVLPFIALKTIFLFFVLKKVAKSDSVDLEAERYGWHLTGMTVFETVVANVDKLLLWHILGPASVASYIFATSIPIKLADVLRLVNRIAFPKFAESQTKPTQDGLIQKIIKLSVISISLVGTYILAAAWIFNTFFPLYADVVLYTQIASIILLFQPFSLIATLLSAQAKTKRLYIFKVGSPLSRLILMTALIPTLDLLGAVLAFVISKILDSVILFYLKN